MTQERTIANFPVNTLLPICLAALSTGCAQPRHTAEADHEARPLVIDFQYGFMTNAVELQISRQTVFSGVLTTDNSIGFARRVQFTPGDDSSLDARVIVNHSKEYAFRIRPERGRYVGFYKDLDDGRVRMEQSKDPFLYD